MAAITLEKVLTSAEALPLDEQEMLENLLRQRRIDAWRRDTAVEAQRTVRAFRSGKLKNRKVEKIIAHLRKGS